MQIKAHQLQDALQKAYQPPPIFLLGDDELLVQYARDTVTSHFKQEGFRRELYEVDKATAWPSLEQFQSLSLFEEKILYDIRLTSANHLSSGETFIKAGFDSPADRRMVISCPALSKSMQNSALIKDKLDQAWMVTLWPLAPFEWSKMMEQLAKPYGLKLSASQMSHIAESTQGSIIDMKSCLARLYNCYGNSQKLSDEQIAPYIHHEMEFNGFEVLDTLWSSTSNLAPTVDDLTEGSLIAFMGLVSHQLQRFATIQEDMERGGSLESLFSKHHIWPKQQPSIRRAISLHSKQKFERAIEHLVLLDAATKQGFEKDAKRDLIQLLWSFKHPHTLSYRISSDSFLT